MSDTFYTVLWSLASSVFTNMIQYGIQYRCIMARRQKERINALAEDVSFFLQELPDMFETVNPHDYAFFKRNSDRIKRLLFEIDKLDQSREGEAFQTILEFEETHEQIKRCRQMLIRIRGILNDM